jgi:hypothetical protein
MIVFLSGFAHRPGWPPPRIRPGMTRLSKRAVHEEAVDLALIFA